MNSYAIPYVVSVHGMHFNDSATNGQNITELWMAAAKRNEVRNGRDPEILMAKLLASEKTFTVTALRGSFTSLLTSYSPPYRYVAAEVMHAVFSTPRGSKTAFDSGKIDAVHSMLQLKQGEALLDQAHPVCKDWSPALDGGIRRIFAAGPSTAALEQVFERKMPPVSTQFLTALGKPAHLSLVLYRMVSPNLCLLFPRPNRELEAGPWRR